MNVYILDFHCNNCYQDYRASIKKGTDVAPRIICPNCKTGMLEKRKPGSTKTPYEGYVLNESGTGLIRERKELDGE